HLCAIGHPHGTDAMVLRPRYRRVGMLYTFTGTAQIQDVAQMPAFQHGPIRRTLQRIQIAAAVQKAVAHSAAIPSRIPAQLPKIHRTFQRDFRTGYTVVILHRLTSPLSEFRFIITQQPGRDNPRRVVHYSSARSRSMSWRVASPRLKAVALPQAVPRRRAV